MMKKCEKWWGKLKKSLEKEFWFQFYELEFRLWFFVVNKLRIFGCSAKFWKVTPILLNFPEFYTFQAFIWATDDLQTPRGCRVRIFFCANLCHTWNLENEVGFSVTFPWKKLTSETRFICAHVSPLTKCRMRTNVIFPCAQPHARGVPMVSGDFRIILWRVQFFEKGTRKRGFWTSLPRFRTSLSRFASGLGFLGLKKYNRATTVM